MNGVDDFILEETKLGEVVKDEVVSIKRKCEVEPVKENRDRNKFLLSCAEESLFR